MRTEVLEQHPGLLELLQKFLDQSSYEKERLQSSHMAKAVGTMKHSVKTVSQAVTSVPGNLFQRVDSVMDGLSKVLHVRGTTDPQAAAAALLESSKVGAGLENDSGQDNIPLRITLLLMDEVFDLRERNQWLRRQIVAVLRQIIKAMLGDIVNRRIVEYFADLTSPVMLGWLARSVRESLWPGGFPAQPAPPRDEAAKMRTRVAAKMSLFSSLPDDLRRVIGSETSRAGLLVVFDLLQRPVLNKRLSVALLEGVLDTLFDSQDFPAIFSRLHSRSPRVRNELRNSQRKQEDLRR